VTACIVSNECAISSTGEEAGPGPVAFRLSRGGRLVVVAEAIGLRACSSGAAHHAVVAATDAYRISPDSPRSEEAALLHAMQAANEAVAGEPDQPTAAARDNAVSLVMASVLDSHVVVANIGNCRCYRSRAGTLTPLTRDHSALAALDRTLAEAKSRSANAFETHNMNLLTRALGASDTVKPDLEAHALADGDQYLLCTAGLWSSVSQDDIARSLARERNLDGASRSLRSAIRGHVDSYAFVIIGVSRP
jgi:PPM family protein phosphatase